LLHDQNPPPLRLKCAIVSRIKIKAPVNIAERHPQPDGFIRQADRRCA